jgi:hypothetical protein
MKIIYAAAIAAAIWAADPSAGERWWNHIVYLASDELEGRDTGSPGYRKAAEYVAQEFERAGLKAAGTSGYMQPVLFRTLTLEETQSSLILVRDGGAETLVLGQDANLGVSGDPVPEVDAPAVFAGYGLQVPGGGHDDLAGLDLRGRVAVYLMGGPEGIPSALLAHAQSNAERWGALERAGAVGSARILNPASMDVPWERSSLGRLRPSFSIFSPKLEDAAGQKFSATFNPDRAARLFEGAQHSFAEIMALAAARKPLPRFPLPFRIRARVSVRQGKAESPNVIAVLEGSDAKLRREHVVLSAHLDHIGRGRPIDGDGIYNGAMDDASGVASLIEIARSLPQTSARPKRSILFAVVTGEEKGLLGSRFFAVHPTVPASTIVANINFDMFLPIHPLKLLTVYGLDESTLGDDIREVAREHGVAVQTDQEPLRNIFIRSDQYSFVRQGVPAVFFKFGAEKGSPEETLQKEWLKKRYHAPSDDIHQPVDLDGAVRYNGIMLALTIRVANADAAPAWKESSFFRRFVKQ